MTPERKALYKTLAQPLIDQALVNRDFERVQELVNGTFDTIVDSSIEYQFVEKEELQTTSETSIPEELWYDHPLTSFLKEAEIISYDHIELVWNKGRTKQFDIKFPVFKTYSGNFDLLKLSRLNDYHSKANRGLYLITESYIENEIDLIDFEGRSLPTAKEFILGFWNHMKDTRRFILEPSKDAIIRVGSNELKRSYEHGLAIKRELTSYLLGAYARRIATKQWEV